MLRGCVYSVRRVCCTCCVGALYVLVTRRTTPHQERVIAALREEHKRIDGLLCAPKRPAIRHESEAITVCLLCASKDPQYAMSRRQLLFVWPGRGGRAFVTRFPDPEFVTPP